MLTSPPLPGVIFLKINLLKWLNYIDKSMREARNKNKNNNKNSNSKHNNSNREIATQRDLARMRAKGEMPLLVGAGGGLRWTTSCPPP